MIDIKHINAEERRFDGLRDRFDIDLKCYYLDKFIFKDSEGHKIPQADSITLNDPRTYADRVISTLGTASRTINVYECDGSIQRRLEKRFNSMLELSDDLLELQDIEPIDSCENFLFSIRGWMAARVLAYHDGDRWQFECMPLDPRWIAYEADRKGLVWGSYVSRMTASQVWDLFKYEVKGGQDATVKAIWTREESFHYIGEAEVQRVEHNLGHVPMIITVAPTQPMLVGSFEINEDQMKRRGESIYAANRDLYPKMNELVSVWATLNKMQFLSPLIYINKEGKVLKERPYGIGVVITLKEGEQLIELPTKQLGESGQRLITEISAELQRGALSQIDYGDSRQELSALAMAKLTEASNFIFQPRLKAKSRFKKHVLKMWANQINKGGYETDIDEDCEYITFEKLDDFKKTFSIKADYFSLSPEQNLTNYTLANAAKAIGLSRKTVLKDIMHVPDTEEEIRQADTDAAHDFVPELKMYDFAIALSPGDMNEKDVAEDRANIIMWKLNQLMNQEQQQGMPVQGIQNMMTKLPGVASQPKAELKQPSIPVQKLNTMKLGRNNIREQEQGKKAIVSENQ